MAQRRRAGETAGFPSTLLFRMAPLFLLFADRARQAEEGRPVPACACHLCRNRAQGGKEPVLIAESLVKDFDQDGSTFHSRVSRLPAMGKRRSCCLELLSPGMVATCSPATVKKSVGAIFRKSASSAI